MKYNALLSYSHAADDALAPSLQSALHRFARTWNRLRALRVFRDKTSLAASPELWPAIIDAPGQSGHFLLLASPAAAASRWLLREIDWWLQHRPAQQLLILLTDGELVWDNAAGDFDWRCTTALPASLRGGPMVTSALLRLVSTGSALRLDGWSWLAGLAAPLLLAPAADAAPLALWASGSHLAVGAAQGVRLLAEADARAAPRTLAMTAAPAWLAPSPQADRLGAAAPGGVWAWTLTGGPAWRSAPLSDACGRHHLADAAPR